MRYPWRCLGTKHSDGLDHYRNSNSLVQLSTDQPLLPCLRKRLLNLPTTGLHSTDDLGACHNTCSHSLAFLATGGPGDWVQDLFGLLQLQRRFESCDRRKAWTCQSNPWPPRTRESNVFRPVKMWSVLISWVCLRERIYRGDQSLLRCLQGRPAVKWPYLPPLYSICAMSSWTLLMLLRGLWSLTASCDGCPRILADGHAIISSKMPSPAPDNAEQGPLFVSRTLLYWTHSPAGPQGAPAL